MGVEPEPLPDASVVISGIEELLRGGGKLFSEPLSPPQETTNPNAKGYEMFYMSSFFINYFPIMPTGHPRQEAEKLFQKFPTLKDNLIKDLERTEDIQRLEIVRGITLGKLADFARDRFEESARALGREDNSMSRVAAEYWSRLEEITRSASELEEK